MYEGLVQAVDGRILGHWSARRRPLNRAERAWCAKFFDELDSMFRGKVDFSMAAKPETKANEKTNMVFLAGVIGSTITIDGKRGFFLLDSGPEKNKFIPCSIYDEPELSAKLEKFEKGDFIKTVGYVRAWSKKDDETGEWRNGLGIQLTEIRNEPPKRAAAKPAARQSQITDDDIPF
jgi:hypothetical protein